MTSIPAGGLLTLAALSAAADPLPITPGSTITGISVLGTASVYEVFGHAGNPGGDYGPDTPARLVSFSAGAGNVFSFSASGLVSCCSDTPNIAPDGGSSGTSIVGANGLSSITGNSNIPLVGAFTSDSDPYGKAAPAALNFDANHPSGLSPLLDQVFYIGDGKAGRNNAVGATLNFLAPADATRLYVGVIDSYSFDGLTGYYNDNLGSFTVSVGLTSAVPEASALVLMSAGLGLLAAATLRRSASAG